MGEIYVKAGGHDGGVSQYRGEHRNSINLRKISPLGKNPTLKKEIEKYNINEWIDLGHELGLNDIQRGFCII